MVCTGLLWIQHTGNAEREGPDVLIVLVLDFKGADIVLQSGLYIAGNFGYTFPNSSVAWNKLFPPSFVLRMQMCVRYVHNINMDMTLGWGKRTQFFALLGASIIREKLNADIVVFPSGQKATFVSKTPSLWAPKVGLGTRFMVSDQWMMSIQCSKSFYGRIDDKRHVDLSGAPFLDCGRQLRVFGGSDYSDLYTFGHFLRFSRKIMDNGF